MKQCWIILGATSSIARAFAHVVAEKGCDVVLAGRDMDDIQRSANDIRIRYNVAVDALSFDATDYPSHKSFVKKVESTQDVTINIFCAFGNMHKPELMNEDFSLVESTIATNYTGLLSALMSFEPVFQQQKAGNIVVLGSVAGDRGRIGNYVYGSAKAGVHTFLQGFRAKMSRIGVHVATVKPGFIDTAMTFGLPGMFLVASPENCAKACYQHATKRHNSRYFPWFWFGIMNIIKHIPEFIFKKLNI